MCQGCLGRITPLMEQGGLTQTLTVQLRPLRREAGGTKSKSACVLPPLAPHETASFKFGWMVLFQHHILTSISALVDLKTGLSRPRGTGNLLPRAHIGTVRNRGTGIGIIYT